jgi:Domain of unknown function (DUF4342)
MNEPHKQQFEEFKLKGESVLAKIKELVHEGNVRRIILKNDEGRTLIEIPLTIGVIGALLLPAWAAIGAVAALAADLTIVIERDDPNHLEPPKEDRSGAQPPV